jgi:endonuclease VIII
MEGPSLVILKEELKPFLNKKVLRASGNTKQPKETLIGQKLEKIETWGKVLFLIFGEKSPLIIKTHFMMFGSYSINKAKANRQPRLELKFKNGSLYFYACSILFEASDYYNNIDRKVDVLSPDWDEKYVVDLLKQKKNSYLCDLFLDQHLFAGSGNIVKNEVLFNLRKHPLTKLGQVQQKDWPVLVHAVRDYCEKFYQWKKDYVLRQHWQIYRKSTCPLCKQKLQVEILGRTKRKTFFCAKHQALTKKSATLKLYEVLPVKGRLVKEPRLEH